MGNLFRDDKGRRTLFHSTLHSMLRFIPYLSALNFLNVYKCYTQYIDYELDFMAQPEEKTYNRKLEKIFEIRNDTVV